MMASESCSTSSSSSGDDFVPISLLRKVTKSFRRIYDKKRSTIRWMKRMQLQLQLKLSSMKTKAIQTWTCVRLLLEWRRHSGVSVESVVQGSKTGTRLLFWLCRVCGESSRSVEGLHVDLQLSRSTCQCFQASWPHSVMCSWTALTGFLDMTKRPHPATSEWKSFVFLHLRSLVDGSLSHHCLYLFYTFVCWSRRAATQQTSLKFLVPRKPMKAHAILSVLVDLAAAESATCSERPFSASPSNSVDLVMHAVRSIVPPLKGLGTVRTINSWEGRHGEWTCSTEVSRTQEIQRVASPRHVYLGRGFCAIGDRPAQVARVRKGQMCNTRATNKVHINQQPVGESKKRGFNLLLDQLPRQNSSSNFYQTRVIRWR